MMNISKIVKIKNSIKKELDKELKDAFNEYKEACKKFKLCRELHEYAILFDNCKITYSKVKLALDKINDYNDCNQKLLFYLTDGMINLYKENKIFI